MWEYKIANCLNFGPSFLWKSVIVKTKAQMGILMWWFFELQCMPYTKCVPSHTLCQAFSSTSYVRAWGMGASSLFLSLKKQKHFYSLKRNCTLKLQIYIDNNKLWKCPESLHDPKKNPLMPMCSFSCPNIFNWF